jgi:hypothetical protein
MFTNPSKYKQIVPRHIHHKKRTWPPVHINNVQLLQGEDVKYLGLHLDRRLTWHKHIFLKRKQLGITLIQNVLDIQTQVKTLCKQQTSYI